MGWMHSSAVPLPPPSAGIPFSSAASVSSSAAAGNSSTRINDDISINAAAAMYRGSYSSYPAMAVTAENIGMAAAIAGNVESSTTRAYGMTPQMPLQMSLPSSPSSSQMYPAQTSSHDYNRNHHTHSHSHSLNHNHHNHNPYGYMDCRTASVAAIPQQSSSLYMAPESGYPPMTANTNRVMRNLAEKNRRDKLNTFIGELSKLVPMVSNSPKKMDKTSVLRLATTYLRMHRITEATRNQSCALPPVFNSSEWPQSLLDKMDGVMLIVTSAGKIVFISHNVEKVLGHPQTELMGHSLSNITYPSDLNELKRCLTPDKEDENCSDNVADTSNGALIERQRRSFCLRLRHRCLARSEQPQYEPMQLNGFLRVPKKYTAQAQKKSRKCKAGEITATNSNEILLVAVMKPARDMTLMSIVEASQEEYVTRHWYDGRIVFCDQRISIVSGYLPEEVKGLQAFQFMAREEVHWVMIALRQMLWNREGFGKSCYRLKRKNGDFIYLVTHGYLEPCEDLQKSTFVCINTLVSREEGEREIRNMKRKFTPIIERRDEPAIAVIAEKNTLINEQDDENRNCLPSTEDPIELKHALKAMVTNIPVPTEVKEDPEKCRQLQFAKAKYFAKTLPPASIPCAKVITITEEKTTTNSPSLPSSSPLSSSSSSPLSASSASSSSKTLKHERLSPMASTPTSTCGSSSSSGIGSGNSFYASTPSPQHSNASSAVVSPRSTSASSPGSVASSAATSFQNRPSVLRRAPARQSSVASPLAATAVVANASPSADTYVISSTSNFDAEMVGSVGDDKIAAVAMSNNNNNNNVYEDTKYAANFSCLTGYEVGVGVEQNSTNCDFIKREFANIKQESTDVDDMDDEDLQEQLVAVMNQQQVAAAVAAVAAEAEREHTGVVVNGSGGRSAVKRHLDCDTSSSSSPYVSSIVPIKKNAHSASNTKYSRHQRPQTLQQQQQQLRQQQKRGVAAANGPLLSPHQVSSSTTYSVHQNGNATPYSAIAPIIDSGDFLLETTDISQIDEADIVPCEPPARCEPEAVLQLLNNENLKHRHNELETKMHIQGEQIHGIEGDLAKVPFTSEQLGFQTNLTHLKEQHVMQKKMLMTLQQDHHSLQHCSSPDAIIVTNNIHQNHQNVGV